MSSCLSALRYGRRQTRRTTRFPWKSIYDVSEWTGISADAVTINGGYLESHGRIAISCDSFSNTGGVVKAIGADHLGIKAEEHVTFNGGVTIAQGGKAAIQGNTQGENVKYWESLGGAVDGAGTDVSDVTGSSVVIAKAIALPEEPDEDNNCNGGSYFEYAGNGFALDSPIPIKIGSTNNDTSTAGTLVCINAGEGVALSADNLAVDILGTLYADGVSSSEDTGCDGNLISSKGFSVETFLDMYGGYVSDEKGISSVQGLTLTFGNEDTDLAYITALNSAGVGLTIGESGSVYNYGAVITAVGSTTAYNGPALEGVELLGAAAKYSKLDIATVATDKVLLIKKAGGLCFAGRAWFFHCSPPLVAAGFALALGR